MLKVIDKKEKETIEVFERMKLHKEPYETEVNGFKIVVYPNVFSPAYFTDSAWFASELPKIVGYKTFLEIGTGTGIVALSVAKTGAKVTATDINPIAVENAKANFQRYNLNVKIVLGDMYFPLNTEDKFEYIFWNHPFNRGNNPNIDMLFRAGFDYKYLSLENYIRGASNHLKSEGHLLLGTSNFADLSSVQVLAMKYGYSLKLLRNIRMPISGHDDFDNEYYIYELIRR